MKKFKISIILSIFPAYIFAQDTLQHFNFDSITPIIETYTSNQGYYTGHNNYGDEEFAEKYEFTGTSNILGVIAIHQVVSGNSSMNGSYKIYEVGGNGLPSTELASKSVAYNDIPVNGTPNTVIFTNPVSISSDFFISLISLNILVKYVVASDIISFWRSFLDSLLIARSFNLLSMCSIISFSHTFTTAPPTTFIFVILRLRVLILNLTIIPIYKVVFMSIFNYIHKST